MMLYFSSLFQFLAQRNGVNKTTISIHYGDTILIKALLSISSTFLCSQIPKAQKNTDDLDVFFALSGSACVKAARKMLVKLTPGRLVANLCSI
jgi:hypothetical protein